MTRLHELADLGQAVWFDFIRRSFTESGKLGDLIDRGVRGVTSNPTIFEKAIAGSADYDADLRRLIDVGRSLDEIYETLVVEDIRAAAALLRPLYDATGGWRRLREPGGQPQSGPRHRRDHRRGAPVCSPSWRSPT